MLSPTDATPPPAGLGSTQAVRPDLMSDCERAEFARGLRLTTTPATTPDHALIIRTLVATLDDLLALARHARTRDGRLSAPVVEKRCVEALREMGGCFDVR